MIKKDPEKDIEVLIKVAEEACIAARTAPKANGIDFIETAVIYGDEITKLSNEMKRIGEEKGLQFFVRDSDNILGHVVILIGTRLKEKGHSFCENTSEETNIYTTSAIDLGIAIGSLVSILSEKRIDNRVMYSIGEAAIKLQILGKDVKIAYGIPLSISGKNPFFDRR